MSSVPLASTAIDPAAAPTLDPLPPALTLRVRKILVPTDHSACAERAYAPAADLAAHTGAVVQVVRVAEYGPPLPASAAPITWDDVALDLRLPTEETPPSGPVDVETVEASHASTAGAILDAARTHRADLIVMGTHGRRGLARMVMGSVAEEVVRTADCPVLTVSCHNAPEGGPVLVPVDFSDGSRQALRHGRALAAERGVPLHVVHVADWPVSPPPYLADFGLPSLPDVLARAQTDLDAFVAETAVAEPLVAEPLVDDAFADDVFDAGTSGRDVATSVQVRVGGLAAFALTEYASEIGASLVVISTHGRTGLDRLLMGSVAERVVRTAPCPVLTVRPEGRGLFAHVAAERAAAAGSVAVEAA